MVKPQDFTTKPKHLIDKRRENVGVYAFDPAPNLQNAVTGNKLVHERLGTITTGQMPSGLSAYVWENGHKRQSEEIVFVWESRRHFPATRHYIREQLLPNSKPMDCSGLTALPEQRLTGTGQYANQTGSLTERLDTAN